MNNDSENEFFDPEDVLCPNGNYFGLPCTPEESRLVILSVPWDVTTSGKGGTSGGPDAIMDASLMIDLYDYDAGNVYRKGIGTLPIDDDILAKSRIVRKVAERVIRYLTDGGDPKEKFIARHIQRVNESSELLNRQVYEQTREQIAAGKKVALVGGDHSTPLGAIRATAEAYPGMGILHIDAHADLRKSYESFTYSHGSIMYNVLQQAGSIGKLVQVGIRDFCETEYELTRSHPKIRTFYNDAIQERLYAGETWDSVCETIVAELPRKVYVSFDIDGLKTAYCPSTGTPVPGGLEYDQACYLIRKITRSGREIVGFDLCEVAPDPQNQWDAYVGAKLLYHLAGQTLK